MRNDMAKLLLIIFLILFLPIHAHAIGINTGKYFDYGLIYSGTKYPQSVANDMENVQSNIDLSKLKQGKASTRKFFGLVEVGNASIEKAAKKANITKIHYVDTSLNKVYVPYFIIPISVRQKTTIVYGE